jgi:hypothetical protein
MKGEVMPGYRAHTLGSLIVAILALGACNIFYQITAFKAFEWIGFAVIGGLFPDLDTKSFGQKWFYRVLFIIAIVLFSLKKYYLLSIEALIGFIPLLFRHRGLFHAPWFLSMIALGGSFAAAYYFPEYQRAVFIDGAFFWLGAMIHLVMDRYFRN